MESSLSLLCEDEHEIMHFAYGFTRTQVFLAVLWEKLFTKEEDEVLQVCIGGQLDVLFR